MVYLQASPQDQYEVDLIFRSNLRQPITMKEPTVAAVHIKLNFLNYVYHCAINLNLQLCIYIIYIMYPVKQRKSQAENY